MARSQSVVLFARAGLPNRHVVIFLGAGPCGVFPGEPEKAVAQGRIGAVAGEAAATLGLFAKVKRLRHRTHSQRGGSPLRGSQCRRLRMVAGNLWIVSPLCPVCDSIPASPENDRDSDWFQHALY